jgi:NAD+ kinase
MLRLGVVGHSGYADLPAALRTLLELAPGLQLELALESELLEIAGAGKRLEDPSALDALLTLGGDGTLLRGARLITPHQVPILGVNMGRLGFLTGCPADQLPMALMRFARGDYAVETRMAVEARLLDSYGAALSTYVALNDVVVHKGGFARVVEFAIAADGEAIATYGADGIVLSTPTGSTAYSLSAGGPVVYPTLETIVVTPVSAHTLAVRPLILPADVEVTVHANDAPGELLMTVDGQVGSRFGSAETLSVRRAANGIRIVRFPGTSFFATLRQKLGWGGLMGRDGRS